LGSERKGREWKGEIAIGSNKKEWNAIGPIINKIQLMEDEKI
jgi:hypothetical protein